KTAIEHMQMTDVSKLSSLLPGGVTAASNNLTSTGNGAGKFGIRTGVTGSELGNSTFTTAVEVDGVRLSNNASFLETAGVSTKNIAYRSPFSGVRRYDQRHRQGKHEKGHFPFRPDLVH
ncbi:MAG: hypothetical protein QMB59_06905, partial [Bacteroidales bacterium]